MYVEVLFSQVSEQPTYSIASLWEIKNCYQIRPGDLFSLWEPGVTARPCVSHR